MKKFLIVTLLAIIGLGITGCEHHYCYYDCCDGYYYPCYNPYCYRSDCYYYDIYLDQYGYTCTPHRYEVHYHPCKH